MALPYSPRATYDTIIDLGQTSDRAFQGTGIAGKHVLLKPKPAMDTARGILVNGAASVTLIGGHFKPSSRALWPAGNNADGSFVFFDCGEFFLEGVHLDNADVGYLDGVQCSAISSLTQCTLQNMLFDNIQGLESDLHGDIFQTGSTNMGRTGPVRIHNATGFCNYQGLFLDPQNSGTRGGGLTSVTLSNVNIIRNGTTTSRLMYFYANASRYDTEGYPISITNCYLDPGSGQLVQRDAVWPASYAGSGNNFPNSSYWAVRGTDSNGAFAHWPGLNASGKALVGKVYEGRPPGGNFVRPDQVGVGYVQGTDLSSSEPVDASEIQFYRHF